MPAVGRTVTPYNFNRVSVRVSRVPPGDRSARIYVYVHQTIWACKLLRSVRATLATVASRSVYA